MENLLRPASRKENDERFDASRRIDVDFIRLLVVQDEVTCFIYRKPCTIRTIKCASIEHALDREQWARGECIMAKPLCHEQCGLLKKRGRHDLWSISDRKSTRLNSSHVSISYAVFCLKKKKKRRKKGYRISRE